MQQHIPLNHLLPLHPSKPPGYSCPTGVTCTLLYPYKSVPSINWISYTQADVMRKQIGSALIHQGLKKGDMVGISSQNTAEWTLLSLGCDTQVLATSIFQVCSSAFTVHS